VQYGQAVEWSYDFPGIVEFARLTKGLVEDGGNHSIYAWVDRFNLCDMGLDHFANTDLLRGDPSGEFGRR
jgi:hypothetical protein